jgi:cytochrome c553
MRSRLLVSLLIIITAGTTAGMTLANDPAPTGNVSFIRDIRPILANNCFACHGPDEAARKAELRLDTREGALAADGPIAPGRPEESELLRRLTAADPAERMPPAEANKTLTDEQIELLRRWIASGADWDELWSFVAPSRPAQPTVGDASWSRNPIDRFVLARMEADGLRPSLPADPITLVRRVTLDLTGLPPTPEQVEAFLDDAQRDHDSAYASLVERLLESPHYGERMALEWLDAARFADTNGYHIDNGRDMTRWREWVIGAFNRNLPFDRFTIEQLAGDLLPEPTLEQQIASGFNRNHMINFEGGAIPQEYHTAYIIDRVNTTGMVWLGLSIGCAQCHDHKYDPLTQRDFYQLYAFFHNVPENGLDGNQGNAAPFIKATSPAEQQELDRLTGEIARLAGDLAAPQAALDAAQIDWETEALSAARSAWTTLEPTQMRSEGGAEMQRFDDGSILVSGTNPATDVYTIAAPLPVGPWTGVRLEALPHESFDGGGPGRSVNGNIVLTGLTVAIRSNVAEDARQPVALVAATADFSQQGYDVATAIDDDPASGWAIHPEVGKPHAARFRLERPIEAGAGAQIIVTLRFESSFGQHQLGHFRLATSAASDPLLDDPLPEPIRAILAVSATDRTAEQATTLMAHFRQHISPVGRQWHERLVALRGELAALDQRIPTAMVMQELPQPRETFVLLRGQYDKPGQRVEAAVPGSLPPLPDGVPANRLGLARWLVDPAHPLTARVIVNRYWQMYFGTGLVKTSEDFGSQGELPSHPELLDWLAREFVEGGWDVKHMQRMIVTSATYRQSSAVSAALAERDPENRLLARGPRHRLPAEFIRDQALAASGLLDRRIGGGSVSPYQPAGLWDELASRADGANWTAQTYTQSHGADLYRRTMYTFWKRTSPPPTLSAFDAPDRETCTVRRARTNTPLQALILMNDPTYVEASRHLAERVMRDGGETLDGRIELAFRLLLARSPRPAERTVLRELFQAQLAVFQADGQAAESLLSVGESPRDAALDPAELAAWTAVASVLLNLDETVTKG